jgi:hypothetical protein
MRSHQARDMPGAQRPPERPAISIADQLCDAQLGRDRVCVGVVDVVGACAVDQNGVVARPNLLLSRVAWPMPERSRNQAGVSGKTSGPLLQLSRSLEVFVAMPLPVLT